MSEIKCPLCNGKLLHLHNTVYGMPETHIAGTERFSCNDCGTDLTREEAIAAGCRYVLDVEPSMRIKMKSAIANLTWHLFIVCPYCNKTIDLADSDYNCEGDISRSIFNNEWGDLEGLEVECEHCKQTFEISEVEY